MKIRSKTYRVAAGAKIDLANRPTRVKPAYGSKEDYHQQLADHVEHLSARQQLLYSSNRYAVLLIFQGMDTAGKDGVIRHVMSGVNPQGCEVFSFKHPSVAELQHDFLWRAIQHLPERGRIGIFNRSYYEEVLVPRVHPEVLRSEGVPDQPRGGKIWRARFRSIINLERHLHVSGTRIAKVFLHLSRDEQRKRLLARIDDPQKNWKFSMDDVEERRRWDDYMEAYQDLLGATSTRESPWYVVPADDKENARLIVSQIILDTIDDLQLSYPKVSAKRRAELKSIRKLLDE